MFELGVKQIRLSFLEQFRYDNGDKCIAIGGWRTKRRVLSADQLENVVWKIRGAVLHTPKVPEQREERFSDDAAASSGVGRNQPSCSLTLP